jgi:hypothetical protein
MASGICVQPSEWGDTPGEVDDLHIADVQMSNVASPVHVAAKSPSTIGHITIERLSATGVYRAAASFESWTDQPLGRVDLLDCDLRYAARSAAWSNPMEAARALVAAKTPDEVGPPGIDSRPLPAWGLYARHVRTLHLANVRLSIDAPDRRASILLDDVGTLESDRTSDKSTTLMKNVPAIVPIVAD